MVYPDTVEAVFVSRPNRFIAEVEVGGTRVQAHVKNTGRCAELFVLGRRVWLSVPPSGGARKTKYDLVTVEKPDGDSGEGAAEETEDYPVHLFVSRAGYFKKITPASWRMSSEHKLTEGDEIVLEDESVNSAELLVFSDRCQLYKTRAADFEETKASAMGDHRIAMLLAVLASGCKGDSCIIGAEAVKKSDPNFFEQFTGLGGIYHVI